MRPLLEDHTLDDNDYRCITFANHSSLYIKLNRCKDEVLIGTSPNSAWCYRADGLDDLLELLLEVRKDMRDA